jgi:hypothetical protein
LLQVGDFYYLLLAEGKTRVVFHTFIFYQKFEFNMNTAILISFIFFIFFSFFSSTSSISLWVYGTHQKGNDRWSYDRNGIPFYDYGKYGTQINPLFVSIEVIYHSKHNDPQDYRIAINNAEWLVNNSLSVGNYSLLLYNFPAPAYQIHPPWVSAMTQARAAVAMINAHKITHDDKYLDFARRFLNALDIDTEKGGVAHKSDSNGWWYEEYASKNGPQPRVLNGMMAVLSDLNKYYRYTNDTFVMMLIEKGMISLSNNLYKYDVNRDGLQGYSFYDALGKLPGESYHKYHVALLSNLLNMTGGEGLQKYYDKWKAYEGPFPKRLLNSTEPLDNAQPNFDNVS